jgi:hypothetical protein
MPDASPVPIAAVPTMIAAARLASQVLMNFLPR